MNTETENTLHVLLFSVLQDAVDGQKELEWPLDGDMTVGDLLGQLYARWPELQKWDAQIRVGVDLEYVERNRPLRAGEEVAIMPPVQGG